MPPIKKNKKNIKFNPLLIDIEMKEKINYYYLLDISYSMQGDRLKNAKKAILSSINNLDKHNNIAIYTFNNRTNILLDLINIEKINKIDIISLLNNIQVNGSTSIYDAIFFTINKINDKSECILITDGEDNYSFYKYASLLDKLSEHKNILLNILHIKNDNIINDEFKVLCEQQKGKYKIINDNNIVNMFENLNI